MIDDSCKVPEETVTHARHDRCYARNRTRSLRQALSIILIVRMRPRRPAVSTLAMFAPAPSKEDRAQDHA